MIAGSALFPLCSCLHPVCLTFIYETQAHGINYHPPVRGRDPCQSIFDQVTFNEYSFSTCAQARAHAHNVVSQQKRRRCRRRRCRPRRRRSGRRRRRRSASFSVFLCGFPIRHGRKKNPPPRACMCLRAPHLGLPQLHREILVNVKRSEVKTQLQAALFLSNSFHRVTEAFISDDASTPPGRRERRCLL